MVQSTLAPTKYSSKRVPVVQSSSIRLSPCSFLAFASVLAAIAVPSANTYFWWAPYFWMFLVRQSRASCVSHIQVSRDQRATPPARPCQILHRLSSARQFGQLALPTAYASQRYCNVRQFSKPPSPPADVTMSKLSLAMRAGNTMERGPSHSAASPSARYWRAALTSSAHVEVLFMA